MFGIGPIELVVILVVALLVFGPKRVPELARTVGRGLAEFRRASSDLRQTLALDELKQDLQRDLTGNQTIQKPGNRPAQAGDDADSSDRPTTLTEEPAAETSSKTTIERKHPGENRPGGDLGDADNTNDADSNFRGDTRSNTPADSELGNLSVSGSKPADPRRG